MAMSVVYTTLGGRVVYENRGGTERSYLRDPLGNTVGLMDMTGTVTDTYAYWPYGEERVHTGSSSTPLTFLGTLGYFKDFLNMLYVRARHLRVDLTRWMTVDPLDQLRPLNLLELIRRYKISSPRGGPGPYRYAQDEPTNLVDPTGTSPTFILGGPLLSPSEAAGIANSVCDGSSILTCRGVNDLFGPCTSTDCPAWEACGRQIGGGANQSNWPRPICQLNPIPCNIGGEFCCVECAMRLCCALAGCLPGAGPNGPEYPVPGPESGGGVFHPVFANSGGGFYS